MLFLNVCGVFKFIKNTFLKIQKVLVNIEKFLLIIKNNKPLSIFLGLNLIGLYLTFKFKPKEAYELTFEFSYLSLIITLITICFYAFLIYKLFKKSQQTNKFTDFLIRIKKTIYESLQNVYEYLIYKYIATLLNKLFLKTFIEKTFRKLTNYRTFIYFIVFIFPRLVISCVLFYDIVIENAMFYTYFICEILWIPIIVRILLYIIKHWVSKMRDHLLETFFLSTTYIDHTLFVERENKPNAILIYSDDSYTNYICHILTLGTFYKSLYDKEKDSWVWYFNLFIYLIFLITALYTCLNIF